MPPRQNYACIAACDGRPYLGFQPLGELPSVGGAINSAFRRLGLGASVFGASRTDARVQSTGQVLSFHTRSDITPGELQCALNDALPATIRILALRRAAPSFHAHWSSIGKTYRYRLSPHPLAISAEPAAIDWNALDAVRLRDGLNLLASLPDLSGFSASDKRDGGRVRTIFPPRLLEASPNDGVLVEIQGTGFGRYQIRNLMAAAIAFGTGKLSAPDLIAMAQGALLHPFRAQAEGLCLFRVHYARGTSPFSETDLSAALFSAVRAIPFLENYLTRGELLCGIPDCRAFPSDTSISGKDS